MHSDHASSPPSASGAESADAGDCVSVLLPLPLAGAYDYRAPTALGLSPGDFVVVPLGNREAVGVVWGAGTGEVDRKSTRLNSSHIQKSRMPSSA